MADFKILKWCFWLWVIVIIFNLFLSPISYDGDLDDLSDIYEPTGAYITDTEEIVNKVEENFNDFWESDPITEKTYEIEQKILYYTNKERAAHGLHSLEWDSDLSNVAREHSLDMVENDFFAHENSNGEDPTARAVRMGYNIHKELGGGWYVDGIGENIGMMPTGNVVGMGWIDSDPDSIGEAHVISWMESPGHRENILFQDYDNLGVGVAYDGLNYVATQNFW